MMLLLMYTALYIPFKVCFYDETTDLAFYFDTFVDLMFLTDIIITFNTALEDKRGALEVRCSVIAKDYCKSGWFFVDFLTSIPFQVFERLEKE